MLLYRILSAVVGIPVLLWAAYAGGLIFLLLVGLLILMASHEFQAMVKSRSTAYPLVILVSALLLTATGLRPEFAGLAIFLVLAGHLLLLVVSQARAEAVGLSLLGAFYVAWMLGHLILIRQTGGMGFPVILLCFLITWATDSGAYFAGITLGRHPLSPRISPKKTVEGSLGGVLACVLTVLLFGSFYPILSLGQLFCLALFGSVLGQLGDLAESALKRWAGVKDSGSLIPGHGGVLDRFDSLIFVAPFVYYSISLFSMLEVLNK